ncbi:MAG TPA: hypothetical protein PLP19_11745 [bacterium]|nr:hypothetical protein [bacterium]HPN44154.1 hypothetical protein [bacterium]
MAQPFTGRSSSHKNALPVILIFLMVLSGLLIGIIYANKYRTRIIEKEDMLVTALLMEGRHKQIDTFFSLYAWFETFIKVENFYYNQHQHYAEPARLDSQLISGIDPTTILKKIRNDFWNDRLFLDDFIPYDTLKIHFKKAFGVNYVHFLSALDSSKFRYKFSIDAKHRNYTIKVFEKSDVTLDNDVKDYFIYKHKGQNPHIRFIDKGKKIDLEDFIIKYAEILGRKLDEKE